MTLFTILLFVHVLGAIVAFGPSFMFAIIGSMGGKEPMHANFALRLTHRISHGVLFPLILLQGLTGIGLFLTIPGGIDLTKAIWLDVAIVLYLFALGFSYFVQTPTLVKMIDMSSTPPPPPAPGSAPSACAASQTIHWAASTVAGSSAKAAVQARSRMPSARSRATSTISIAP